MDSLVFSQVCGLIGDIPTCRELIDSIAPESEEILESIRGKILPGPILQYS